MPLILISERLFTCTGLRSKYTEMRSDNRLAAPDELAAKITVFCMVLIKSATASDGSFPATWLNRGAAFAPVSELSMIRPSLGGAENAERVIVSSFDMKFDNSSRLKYIFSGGTGR